MMIDQCFDQHHGLDHHYYDPDHHSHDQLLRGDGVEDWGLVMQ